ncbi:MAG: hypothetical protein CBC91_03175 [Rickettsiales bacterium TMED131]|nr:MAG: hypothetical protein CBC91_03175 [Rickettsiales bacterium TMED131]
MNLIYKKIYILSLCSVLAGCSSLTDLDLATMIDKTENWIFNKENINNAKQEINENNTISENTIEVSEEVFPDINDIPQQKPDFDQIDEEFFASEEKKIEDITESQNKNIDGSNIINIDNQSNIIVKDKSISAIMKIRENIRFKLIKLFLDSDPPVDKKTVMIKSGQEIQTEEKIAIIQFPNNSIIPDESAEEVLNELSKIKSTKKIKLVGHSSKLGSDTVSGKRRNMEMSISRAQTIKNMLIKKGFDAGIISIIGKGDLEPLQDDTKKYGEAVNRRVEIFFISD